MPTEHHFSATDAAARLATLAERWADTDANERASFQPWLLGFCEALGVEAPDPPTDAEAYGWPWPMEKEEILERLVALLDERVEEEQRGIVRWLRPDYQIPRFGADLPSTPLDLAT